MTRRTPLETAAALEERARADYGALVGITYMGYAEIEYEMGPDAVRSVVLGRMFRGVDEADYQDELLPCGLARLAKVDALTASWKLHVEAAAIIRKLNGGA